MTGIRGTYYDGRNSARREVTVAHEDGCFRLKGDGVDQRYPIAATHVSPRLGSIRRSLRFPDGSLCEVDDSDNLDLLFRRQGKGRLSSLLHRWEMNLPLAFLALVLTVALLWGFIKFGIPVLARQVAFAVPPATETSLGRETLEILDKIAFAPSRLPEARRREVAALFQRMTDDLPDARNCRLEFRSSDKIGANAIALPSGIVVITDGLVSLARNDDEIAAVLAHELGHVRYRHSLRHVLQNSATGLIVAAITGDILSATSLSAALPTTLIDAKFSRDFETEADDAAVAYLKSHGIPLKRFADILSRLQAEHDKRDKGEKGGRSFADYFSSHPVTEERVQRFMRGK